VSTLLQRVVLPAADGPLELLPVYVRPMDGDGVTPTGRRSVRVAAGERASFDTFFNAFPAGYWRRWTPVQAVELGLRVRGRGRVDVYRSSGRGRVAHQAGSSFDTGFGDDGTALTFPLPLRGLFTDGGFYWFTVSAADDVDLEEACWHSAEQPAPRPASIGICTFNRPTECLATLRTLAGDPEAVAGLHRVVVVDQGDRRVDAEPGFAEVEAAWGGRRSVVSQGNLGGSGGFSRAMLEVLDDPSAGDVILMDDDIVPEPESVLRALAFATASGGRVIVHGHMLDLWTTSRLHNTGDLVDLTDFSTRAVSHKLEDVDLSESSLAETRELNRRWDSMFGGWWMCLVPRPVLRKLGLSLPLFIKWDDVEYGLRAGQAGHATVTVPGIGVWHMPFHAKDVQTDWTSYFECRNRLIVALLYGEPAGLRGAVLANLKDVVKNLVSMNYSAAELHHMAIEDLFAGPDFVFKDLPEVAGRIREVRRRFRDAEVHDHVPDDFDTTVDLITIEHLAEPPTSWWQGRLNIALGVGHALASMTHGGRARRADLTGIEARWAVLARLEEAAVASADGAGVSLRRRDNHVVRWMLRRAVADHVRVLREAHRLRRTYRTALPELTSPDRWRALFQ
jgi:galactofuranosylgalactofuranosylrhamnosyl-N-acetylglucosaminyl-diphospho-decaprenol beta-1,5/1,6-galactofuranosyltransferase